MNNGHSLRMSRMQSIINERVRSLVNDGYRVITDGHTMQLHIIRLRHCSNGGDILITADYWHNHMTQKTNGTLTHEDYIWKTNG